MSNTTHMDVIKDIQRKIELKKKLREVDDFKEQIKAFDKERVTLQTQKNYLKIADSVVLHLSFHYHYFKIGVGEVEAAYTSTTTTLGQPALPLPLFWLA